ncbi:hypothetical protein [Clostridium sp. UBA5119]|uniref:hypothetical protein n=1 Tax=Clostridium sp. UBA5119 TaxID=1946366 RepID=UPI003217F5D6
MKKFLSILLSGLVVLGLVGCSSSTASKSDNPPVEVKEEAKEPKKELPPVTIEELPMNLKILEPDSIGERYMEATFTNNSKYAIKGFNVTILLKGKNEKTFISSYDTVMPGETSPKFESLAPETGKAEDIEYLTYDITVVDDKGTEIYLSYDVKLKKYEWL